MPMIPFGEPEAHHYTRQAGRDSDMGIGNLHDRVSWLRSTDSAPEMFDRVLQPRPATRLPLGTRTKSIL